MKKGFLFGLLIALVLLGVFGYHFGPRYFFRFFGYLFLDRVDNRLSQEQLKDLKEKTQGIRARIVWSSSRTGNHELFLLSLPDLQLYQLTHNPKVDYFPRFSPDGEALLFARSRKTWVSERDLDPWDVYLFSLRSRQETLLATEANYPQWIDQDTISYRKKNQVLIRNLKSGAEEIALDGGAASVATTIGTPEFSPRDLRYLAFDAHGKLDGVFVLDRARQTFLKFSSGCQVTWVPRGDEVIWMESGGNGGTRILQSPFSHPEKSLFMDLPGNFSHEYFPRLSRDSRWLVWGASAGDHEHDMADYEIFLWQVGRPFTEAIRLTYNTANDRWPDIFIEPRN